MHLNFKIQSDKIKTHFNNGVFTRGNAWFNGEFLSADGLAGLLANVTTPESFELFIQKLNGSYSLVLDAGNYLFLASDRFASYPLFYYMSENEIFVSDRVSELASASKNTRINEDSVKDITYAGYAYLDETLVNDIYQVIGSEYVIYNKTNHTILKKRHFYFKYNEDDIIGHNHLESSFNSVCIKVADRLVKSLEGRKCAVFLSGGVDSRFCAYLLKLAGYEKNTILITYGTRFSPDYKPAVKTAAKLGMKHIIIPYKRSLWKKTFSDEESLSYIEYAQNLSITAHLREHFVIRELLDKGKIPTDCIIIPGHLGTVAGRKHYPEQLHNIDTIHKRLVTKTALFYKVEDNPDIYKYLWDRTLSLFPEEGPTKDIPSYMNLYNNTIFSTYTVKYLINSLRAYDFYGLEWRLPLLDNEIISFFEKVPFGDKSSKKFFMQYLSSEIDVPYSNFSLNFFRKVFRNILDARYACIDLRKLFTLKNEYNKHFNPLLRAYRYVRNFSAYCSIIELEMMKSELKRIEAD